MDILNTRAAPHHAAPQLTDAMRANLLAQYRADLRRDEAEADAIRSTCPTVYRHRDPTGRRLWHLLHHASATRAAIAELDRRA